MTITAANAALTWKIPTALNAIQSLKKMTPSAGNAVRALRKMKKSNILFMVLVCFLLIGCAKAKKASDVECLYNTDCQQAGCSGEICAGKEKANSIVTTCIYKEEYDCLQKTSCECVDYKCKWAETDKYLGCMNSLK